MLKTNKTLTQLDLSDNEIGAEKDEQIKTPEGPAALAEGLKANQSVQQLDVSANGLGSDGGKAIAASIAENSIITSVRTLFCEISFRIICSYHFPLFSLHPAE